MKMMNKKKPQKQGASEAHECDISQLHRREYYITFLMAVTSIIAGWHIKDAWSGVVALMCALITIWMVWNLTGGISDGNK